MCCLHGSRSHGSFGHVGKYSLKSTVSREPPTHCDVKKTLHLLERMRCQRGAHCPSVVLEGKLAAVKRPRSGFWLSIRKNLVSVRTGRKWDRSFSLSDIELGIPMLAVVRMNDYIRNSIIPLVIFFVFLQLVF